MRTTISLFVFLAIGFYFLYIRPQLNVFDTFKKDPAFTNYMLIIESNSEFDKSNYNKAMKHLKMFLAYYSKSFEDDSMFEKMKYQHLRCIKYLNRMLFSIPNSMRRYTYMKTAIENMDLILKNYLSEVASKYDITYIPV